ncbi:H-2 class II histocompatibility antigen, A-U alpha chain [Danio rerio]|uniref:H-2 class II histocompatibility antigen, A-U alpha chain n=1 Tax=Danio rerio TaxID=7955 RepID=A0AC58G8M7_DANRE|nr:H-2 class II histocompatibility antigen, A-U alpha chain-like [Danio rerio]|eukprot:XP_002660435.3 H-2 class II histocompatibility antigen, A-U alpha chain-like [Danio rerio]
MFKTFSGITFFIFCLIHTEGQSYPEFGFIETCRGSSYDKIVFILDTEEAAYKDIEKEKLVFTLPDMVNSFLNANPQYSLNDLRLNDVGIPAFCTEIYHKILSLNVSEDTEPLEPPWTTVYSRNDVKLNVKNTLICHVTGFFPPPVRVLWTKNNVNVTDGSTISRYYPNKDGTMNVFSRLSFIPEEGDVYGCSVEHKALQQPQTRTWDVEVQQPSIGPSVFCGVSLALGLFGFATGVLFIAKGKKWI